MDSPCSSSQNRLEAACSRALSFGLVSYRAARHILETNMDRVKTEERSRPERPHPNLRGARYYS